MARLYANENFPLPVVEELRRLGHDVLTTLEAGMAGQAIPDEQVLDFATVEARALLTLNRRHFLKLAKSRPEHLGVVVCTFDPDFAGQAVRIDAAIASCNALAGSVLRVNRPGP